MSNIAKFYFSKITILNAPYTIYFSNLQRHDPVILSCESNSITDSEVVFNENVSGDYKKFK